MKKIYIFIFAVVAVLLRISHVYALDDINWNKYDQQWERRDVSKRMEILKRGLSHYSRAQHLYAAGNYEKAEIAASDALKVLPDFSEALYLRAMIAAVNSDERDARRWRAKADKKDTSLSPLEEYDYLKVNERRLRSIYRPSRLLHRMVYYFLGLFFVLMIIVFLFFTGSLEFIEMLFIRLKRMIAKREEPVLDVRNIMKDGDATDDNVWKRYLVWTGVIVIGLALYWLLRIS